MTTPQQPGQQPGAGQPYGQQPATGPQPFGAPQQFGQQPAGGFGQPGAPGSFGQPAGAPQQQNLGQGTGFPAAGQGTGFPAAGQGTGFPAAGQGPAFPTPGQPSTFGPAQGTGGFGPAMPPGRSRGRAGRPRGRISRKVRYIRLGISAVVIIVGVVFAIVSSHSDPGNAAVGDCIGNLPTGNADVAQDASDAKKVDCTDSSASYKVLGIVDDPSGDEINDDSKVSQACSPWKQNTDYVFEESNTNNSGSDSDGKLMCLETIKH